MGKGELREWQATGGGICVQVQAETGQYLRSTIRGILSSTTLDSQIKRDRRLQFARKKAARCLAKGLMQPSKIATKKG